MGSSDWILYFIIFFFWNCLSTHVAIFSQTNHSILDRSRYNELNESKRRLANWFRRRRMYRRLPFQTKSISKLTTTCTDNCSCILLVRFGPVDWTVEWKHFSIVLPLQYKPFIRVGVSWELYGFECVIIGIIAGNSSRMKKKNELM